MKPPALKQTVYDPDEVARDHQRDTYRDVLGRRNAKERFNGGYIDKDMEAK
jgi:hypothetical protein